MSTDWKKTKEYRRIMEILDDYWLSEPEEYSVYVDMYFVKANGEYQNKTISWLNPNIKLSPEKTEETEYQLRELYYDFKSHNKYKELKKELYEKYHKWMEENNIPLLYEVHESEIDYLMVRDLKRLGVDVSDLIEDYLYGGTVE